MTILNVLVGHEWGRSESQILSPREGMRNVGHPDIRAGIVGSMRTGSDLGREVPSVLEPGPSTDESISHNAKGSFQSSCPP
jgi:hypothetical protein